MDMLKIVQQWNSEEEMEESDEAYCSAYLKKVEESEDVDGKYVTYSVVYKDTNTGKFYEAYVVSTNSGYWRESDVVDKYCREVVPQEITKTIYVAIK